MQANAVLKKRRFSAGTLHSFFGASSKKEAKRADHPRVIATSSSLPPPTRKILTAQPTTDPPAPAPAPASHAATCANCEEDAATVVCNECAKPYCDDCWEGCHRKGAKKKHTNVAIEGTPPPLPTNVATADSSSRTPPPEAVAGRNATVVAVAVEKKEKREQGEGDKRRPQNLTTISTTTTAAAQPESKRQKTTAEEAGDPEPGQRSPVQHHRRSTSWGDPAFGAAAPPTPPTLSEEGAGSGEAGGAAGARGGEAEQTTKTKAKAKSEKGRPKRQRQTMEEQEEQQWAALAALSSKRSSLGGALPVTGRKASATAPPSTVKPVAGLPALSAKLGTYLCMSFSFVLRLRRHCCALRPVVAAVRALSCADSFPVASASVWAAASS